MSSPRAATSVQRRMPEDAFINSKNVFVRFCCFCFPCDFVISKRDGNRKGAYMQIEHGNVNIIQQLSVVFHRLAAGEEHNNFLLDIFLQEREQKQKPPI